MWLCTYKLLHAHVIPLKQPPSLTLPYIIMGQTWSAFHLRALATVMAPARSSGFAQSGTLAATLNHALYAHLARGRVAV